LMRHPCCAVIYAIVLLALLPSLPSLHWRCCPCRTCVSPASLERLCRHSASVVTLIAFMSPPASRWRLQRHSAGVDTHVRLASKPSFCWHYCHHQVVTVVALASLPSSRPRFVGIALVSSQLLRRHHWAGVFAIVLLASSL